MRGMPLFYFNFFILVGSLIYVHVVMFIVGMGVQIFQETCPKT